MQYPNYDHFVLSFSGFQKYMFLFFFMELQSQRRDNSAFSFNGVIFPHAAVFRVATKNHAL